MGENEYYQCSSCGTEYDANSDECPNCGGEKTIEKKVRAVAVEPEPATTEQTEDGVSELSPEQIRQDEVTRLATEGGTPQRPSP